MKLYKSCKTLPIFFFFRIFETDDLRNLVHGFDEDNDNFELTEEQKIEFSNIFQEIFYEYNELTNNTKLKSSLKKQWLIAEWEFHYQIISNSINLYSEFKVLQILLQINNIDNCPYKIDEAKPIDPQIKRLASKMKGLKNKIKIFKIKLADSFKDDKKEVKLDLEMDAITLERNLELKREINPKTTSVSTWVGLVNLCKTKTISDGKN